MFAKKYHCIRQQDISDCGAACLATISKQYGLWIPISKIREVAGTDKQGTNAFGIVKAAETLGFNARGVKGDKEALYTDFPLPAIAHVVIDGNLLHYVVLHEISDNKIVVADPAKGTVAYAPDDFLTIWTGVLILLTPNHSFEKGDETTGNLKRFLGLLKPQKKLILHIFFGSILYTILGIAGAFYFKFLLDDIIPYSLEQSLLVVSVGVMLLTVFKIVINAFRSHLLLHLSQKIDIPLILGYYNHVLDLPLNFFGTRKVGEIVSRFMDASKIREAISGATLTIMIDTLMAIGGGVILYTYNSTLFGIAVLMLFLYCILIFAFNKPIKETNREIMEENSQLSSYLIESLNGIETVKAFNAERESKLRTESAFVRLLKKTFIMGKLENLRGSLSILIASIGGNLILWVGAYNVINGKLTVGQLLVFNSLLAYFVDPVKNLINLQPMMQTAVVASDRLGEILDLEIEKSDLEYKKISPEKLYGNIRIENISFEYGRRGDVLKNISLEIKPGEKIAFVGESGSGKTTLVKLLLNYYSPQKGEILFDNNNIKDIQLSSLRNKIAYVPQETFLFSGSIYENLQLGTNNISFEEIVEASKMAKAHDFINDLPLRYNTRLEENGSNLSGGQRQRLSITRAVLKKPNILILDEATSSLDSSTEKAIEEMLNDYSKNMTSIIIAHRLSTIMRCDKIYVMENGEIIEVGTHSELMDLGKKYFEMWKDQLPEMNQISNELEVSA